MRLAAVGRARPFSVELPSGGVFLRICIAPIIRAGLMPAEMDVLHMREKNTFRRGGPSRRGDDFRRTEPLRQTEAESTGSVVAGRNAVLELLKSGRSVDKIYIQTGAREGSVTVIVAEAAKRGVPAVDADRRKLDMLCGGVAHQGVAALASEVEYVGLADILRIAEERGEAPFIVVADSINDPHNLGALIRSACCAGAHGIVIPKRRAVQVTPAVIKSSAGAVEHIAVARVSNLAAAIDELKEKNVWIYAVEADGEPYYDKDFSTGGCAFVLGSEGEGVSRLLRDKADFIVAIPMYGGVGSLNVSAAASVVIFEAARQRHK